MECRLAAIPATAVVGNIVGLVPAVAGMRLNREQQLAAAIAAVFIERLAFSSVLKS